MIHFHDTDDINSPNILSENKIKTSSLNSACTFQKTLGFSDTDVSCKTGVKPRNLCQEWFAASLVVLKDPFYLMSCNTDVKIAAVAYVHQ